MKKIWRSVMRFLFQQFRNVWFNASSPRQNSRHFPNDVFKCISLNENVWILIIISLKFVAEGQINNIPALVQSMTWRRSGDKSLSGPVMVRLPTRICGTRVRWVEGITAHLLHWGIMQSRWANTSGLSPESTWLTTITFMKIFKDWRWLSLW